MKALAVVHASPRHTICSGSFHVSIDRRSCSSLVVGFSPLCQVQEVTMRLCGDQKGED